MTELDIYELTKCITCGKIDSRSKDTWKYWCFNCHNKVPSGGARTLETYFPIPFSDLGFYKEAVK